MHRIQFKIWVTIMTLPILFAAKHAYYIGLCIVDHNTETKSLEIDQKLFTDDLEASVKAKYDVNLYLNTKNEVANADSFLALYFNDHLKFELNGVSQSYSWIGHDGDLDATHCYLEIENGVGYKTISITNSLLLKEFPGQTNMVKLKWKDDAKMFLLRGEETELEFEK
ncbi:MAG: hypothetical protein KDC92_02905 [Bacteroidetes bacterium]|nr:hypothetical protein [Bacteroidota bacterium]